MYRRVEQRLFRTMAPVGLVMIMIFIMCSWDPIWAFGSHVVACQKAFLFSYQKRKKERNFSSTRLLSLTQLLSLGPWDFRFTCRCRKKSMIRIYYFILLEPSNIYMLALYGWKQNTCNTKAVNYEKKNTCNEKCKSWVGKKTIIN